MSAAIFPSPPSDLRALLPHGAISVIARQLRMSPTAVSKALRKAKPAHPAVAAALQLIRETGSLRVHHELAQLLAAA